MLNDVFKQIIIAVLMLPFLLSGSIFADTGTQEQEKIVEKVTVTNIEVPVRVLKKGEPVTDLTVDDFSLYENNKQMTINGFFLKRKTLNIEQTGTPSQTAEPRTFVLVFNVSNYNQYFEKAVNHLFDNILTPTDRLLIFANDKTREFADLKNKDQAKFQLVADLKEEGIKAKRRLLEYINRVESYMKVSDFRRQLSRRDPEQAQRAVDFMKKYMIAWNEYQQNYLLPKTDRFYYFSRYLEKLKGRKWVLNFYQFEFFPRIRPGSDTMDKLRDMASLLAGSNQPGQVSQGRLLENMLNQVNSELVLSKKFPVDSVTKLFYKVDATFHSFFINSSSTAYLQDISYNEVSSDVEKILKGITDITGGMNINSSDLVKSLDTIKQVEDAYYILTYVPTNPNKAGKLKIKVKGKYNVLYDDNFRVDYINHYFTNLEKKIQTPDVKIENLSFKKKILAFKLKDFLMRKHEGKMKGQMNIRIRVTDTNSNVLWDKTRLLTAEKSELDVSLTTFKTIIKGEYNFLIDVKDLLTGKETDAHQSVVIKN